MDGIENQIKDRLLNDPADLFLKTAETLVEQYEHHSKLDRVELPGMERRKRIRKAVKRKHAAEYMLLTLISLGVSVALIRAFLALTGYPQLGTSELHIAHVLWGGLILFIAALMPLLMSNRWAFMMAAILAGAGMGLFIDEVGKFITQSNDYFYRPAAPIIYLFFLITLWLYRRVSRTPTRNPRAEMYRAIDGLGEILDHDLDEGERAEILEQLSYISTHTDNPELVRLSTALEGVLSAENLYVLPRETSFRRRLSEKLGRLEGRWINQRVLKALVGSGMVALGLISLRNILAVVAPLFRKTSPAATLVEVLASFDGAIDLGTEWLSARLTLEGILGLILLAAVALLATGRDQRGIQLGRFSLISYLFALNILLFYIDQFATIGLVCVQLIIIWGLAHYERQHLGPA